MILGHNFCECFNHSKFYFTKVEKPNRIIFPKQKLSLGIDLLRNKLVYVKMISPNDGRLRNAQNDECLDD